MTLSSSFLPSPLRHQPVRKVLIMLFLVPHGLPFHNRQRTRTLSSLRFFAYGSSLQGEAGVGKR